jgi:hypothetical protein
VDSDESSSDAECLQLDNALCSDRLSRDSDPSSPSCLKTADSDLLTGHLVKENDSTTMNAYYADCQDKILPSVERSMTDANVSSPEYIITSDESNQ